MVLRSYLLLLCRSAVRNIVGEESQEVLKRLEEDQEGRGHEDGYFASYSHYHIHEEMLKVSLSGLQLDILTI